MVRREKNDNGEKCCVISSKIGGVVVIYIYPILGCERKKKKGETREGKREQRGFREPGNT